MRDKYENKQNIYEHYVQRYKLREPKIILYDLSKVVDINRFKKSDLQLNSSHNGCNISMDDEVPLKYFVETKSETIRMNPMKNVRIRLSNAKPIDIKISKKKNSDGNGRLHFKIHNIKSIIYKFTRLQHKLYQLTDLKLICRKCNTICNSFDCFEKHCAQKCKYILRKTSYVQPVLVSKQSSCNICFKPFKSYSRLRKHVKRKHDIKLNHKCELCTQNYRSKTLLKLHMRKHNKITQHTEETHNESSSEPEAEFVEDNDEFHHVLNIKLEPEINFNNGPSSDNKKLPRGKQRNISYLCTLCSKTFQKESDLTKHRQILKCSFSCDECGHLFRRHYRIREHMLKHHKQLYIPIKKISRIKVEKHKNKVENKNVIQLSNKRHSAFETPVTEKLKELKIIIRRTSIEECNNKKNEIENNNNIANAIEKAKPITRKRKSSSSRLLYNPLHKNIHLKSVTDKTITINKEISHEKQIPISNTEQVKENVNEPNNLSCDTIRSQHKINSFRTDIKENLSINILSNNENSDQKSVGFLPRELRARNTELNDEDNSNDNVEIPIRRRSTRLSSHKPENLYQNDKVTEKIITQCKKDIPVTLHTRKKSIAETKKEINAPVVKNRATKRQNIETDLPKRITRKRSQTNQGDKGLVSSHNTLIEDTHLEEVPFLNENAYHSKYEEIGKIKVRPKRYSHSENNEKNLPLDQSIRIKEEMILQSVIEIEVPLFKEGTIVQSELEKITTVKTRCSRNLLSRKKSIERDLNVVVAEKDIMVSIPETTKQEPLLTPEETNSLIKTEPIIKEEIINFNDYIGHTTGNSRHKYKCLICDRTFGNYNNALRHVGFKHFNKYPCILCPESFAEDRQLKMHKEQVHTPKLISVIPEREIKTSPHRDEDVVDSLDVFLNKSYTISDYNTFGTKSSSFDVNTTILPDIELKLSPHYEINTFVSEHIALLDSHTSETDMTTDRQLHGATITPRKQIKSISLNVFKQVSPDSVIKNSPRLDLENLAISLPIHEPIIMAPERGSDTLHTEQYSPLESSELFCSDYEDEFQKSTKNISPDNEIIRSLEALVNGHNKSYFETNSFRTNDGTVEDLGCLEKVKSTSKLYTPNESISKTVKEKQDACERINQLSTASGSAPCENLQKNVSNQNLKSTDFLNEHKKQYNNEKVDSSIDIGEKDFELPENLYKGWFETKSIDPSDEISFDNNNEVTFSEVGIEFA